MEINDNKTSRVMVTKLEAGDIVNYYGSFFIITDIEDEDGNRDIVYLNTGSVDSIIKEDILSYINDVNEKVRFVSKSTLEIEEYV